MHGQASSHVRRCLPSTLVGQAATCSPSRACLCPERSTHTFWWWCMCGLCCFVPRPRSLVELTLQVGELLEGVCRSRYLGVEGLCCRGGGSLLAWDREMIAFEDSEYQIAINYRTCALKCSVQKWLVVRRDPREQSLPWGRWLCCPLARRPCPCRHHCRHSNLQHCVLRLHQMHCRASRPQAACDKCAEHPSALRCI